MRPRFGSAPRDDRSSKDEPNRVGKRSSYDRFTKLADASPVSRLGGNARTTILITMTTAPVHLDESLSTLRFGQLCKLIKNSARENVQLSDKMVAAKLQQEVLDLKQELEKYRDFAARAGAVDGLLEGHLASTHGGGGPVVVVPSPRRRPRDERVRRRFVVGGKVEVHQ